MKRFICKRRPIISVKDGYNIIEEKELDIISYHLDVWGVLRGRLCDWKLLKIAKNVLMVVVFDRRRLLFIKEDGTVTLINYPSRHSFVEKVLFPERIVGGEYPDHAIGETGTLYYWSGVRLLD